jgi:hypothetical protein
MFSHLNKLFSKKASNNIQSRELDTYFRIELNKCGCIPEGRYELVLCHLRHQLKLDHAMIESEFYVDKSGSRKIFAAIRHIYYKATCHKAWDDNYIKMYMSGVVKKATLRKAGSNEHCDYCLASFDKTIPITVETFNAFHKNCSCKPYKCSFFEPVVSFDK